MIQSIIENFVKIIPDHIAVKELDTGKEISYLSLYEEVKKKSKSIDDTPYGVICLPNGIDFVIEFLAHAFVKKPFLSRPTYRGEYASSLQDKFLKENFHPITDGYQIRTSSGTTDLSKFFFSTQKQRVHHALTVGEKMHLSSDDTVMLLCCPITTGLGDSTTLRALLHGATLFCRAGVDGIKQVKQGLEDIKEHKPSIIMSTSGTLSEIQYLIDDENIILSPRAWYTGSSQLIYDHAVKIESVIQGVVINTASRSDASEPQMCDINDTQERRIGSVGKHSASKIKIADDGEIMLSKDICAYQINNPLTQNWYGTGDLGRIDEDGYLYMTGRKKLLISLGGRDVNPIEVEVLVSYKSCLVKVGSRMGDVGGDLCLCLEFDIDPRKLILDSLNVYIKHLWVGKIPEFRPGKIDRRKLTEMMNEHFEYYVNDNNVGNQKDV